MSGKITKGLAKLTAPTATTPKGANATMAIQGVKTNNQSQLNFLQAPQPMNKDLLAYTKSRDLSKPDQESDRVKNSNSTQPKKT